MVVVSDLYNQSVLGGDVINIMMDTLFPSIFPQYQI